MWFDLGTRTHTHAHTRAKHTHLAVPLAHSICRARELIRNALRRVINASFNNLFSRLYWLMMNVAIVTAPAAIGRYLLGLRIAEHPPHGQKLRTI